MARKAKKKAVRRPGRPPVQQGIAAPAQATRVDTPSVVGGGQALVRSVEMSLAPRNPVKRGGRVVLDNTDPAIPIDRVPYFVTDLKRLGIVAAAMVVVLVGGAQLIPLVVR